MIDYADKRHGSAGAAFFLRGPTAASVGRTATMIGVVPCTKAYLKKS